MAILKELTLMISMASVNRTSLHMKDLVQVHQQKRRRLYEIDRTALQSRMLCFHINVHITHRQVLVYQVAKDLESAS